MKKLLLIILTLFLFQNLLQAEKRIDILSKQADRYYAQQQFEKAIEFYQMILEEQPQNAKIIEKLFNVHIRISQLDKAEEILLESEEFLSTQLVAKLKITLYLRKGNITKARQTADELIQNNPQHMNYYPMLANLFEAFRHYEIAIDFLQAAREKSGNPFVYARELAFDFQNINDMQNAVKEYLKLVDDQNRYSSYVINRLKQILRDDPKVIQIVEKYTKENEDQKVQEIYALALGEVGEYQKALLAYEKLSPAMLLRFANRQYTYQNFQIALQAYQNYLEKPMQIFKKADIQIKIAQIYLKLENYLAAEQILQDIRNEEELQKRQNRYRTRANIQARKLLADIAIRTDKQPELTEKYLREAKSFTFNDMEKKMIDLDLVNFQILQKKMNNAKTKLQEILQNEEPGSDIYKRSFYYSYLIARLENDPIKDSLLSECIINSADSPEINDVLMLENILNAMEADQDKLLDAFLQKKNYRVKNAVKILEKIFADSGNENILFLAADWASSANLEQEALALLQYEYKDEVLMKSAELKLTEILDRESEKRSSVFLAAHPNSVFSPLFRRILEKQ